MELLGAVAASVNCSRVMRVSQGWEREREFVQVFAERSNARKLIIVALYRALR